MKTKLQPHGRFLGSSEMSSTFSYFIPHSINKQKQGTGFVNKSFHSQGLGEFPYYPTTDLR